MGMNKVSTKNLKVGMTVEVNPQSDRTRKKIVQGVISKILTRAENHPHGILVVLESGEKGRVKRILEGEINSAISESKSSQISIETNKISGLKFKELIDFGENHLVEFKCDALWSSNFTNEDIKNHRPQTKELHVYGKATSKMIIAKTLAGFLNSDGGSLIIGVKENKEGEADRIVGVEQEFKLLKDPCEDGYRRMIVDLIKDYFPSRIFNQLNRYFHIAFEEVNDHLVCGITASKSDKRAFIKLKNVDHFYIRTDASTRELIGEEVVEYCQNRFL
jgi:uncharacterized repeat protein (TIGR03833 family)